MKGIVIKPYTSTPSGSGNPHSFDIKGIDDGKVYFCHLGDIKQNEDKLYRNTNTPTAYLKADDIVEFRPLSGQLRACSVREINKEAANDPDIQAAIKKISGSGA